MRRKSGQSAVSGGNRSKSTFLDKLDNLDHLDIRHSAEIKNPPGYGGNKFLLVLPSLALSKSGIGSKRPVSSQPVRTSSPE